MPRQAEHKETRPHPSPRFKDKVRLHRFLRSVNDDIWHATFHFDGKWQTRKPISLKTRDFDEACEVARDTFVKVDTAGLASAQKRPAAPKPVEHAFRVYAEMAIATLEAEAQNQGIAHKAHNYKVRARRIKHDLIPRWGDTDIRTLTEHDLTDWVADEYRVVDRKTGERHRAAANTLGNLDHALRDVWSAAASAKVVERRLRPRIDKTAGEDVEQRAFIDKDGIRALARLMNAEWINRRDRFPPEHKRMFRTYIAMLACTGIRPGAEAMQVRIGDVEFRPKSIVIFVRPKQGKHHLARRVVVLEGGDEFQIKFLLEDQVHRRKADGAAQTDLLFAVANGDQPTFRNLMTSVLQEANVAIDPMTGLQRSAYSIRHFFATRLIESGFSVPRIAAWLGTSSMMVDRHYNRFLIDHEADQINGRVIPKASGKAEPIPLDAPEYWRTPEDDLLDELETEQAALRDHP